MTKISKLFLKIGLTTLLIFLSFILIVFVMGCCTFSGPSYKGKISRHFDGEIFRNQDNSTPRTILDMFKWRLTNNTVPWPKWWNEKPGSKPIDMNNSDTFIVTFINHSTVLIQTCGINILTDPIWSDKPSPFSWIGPERHRHPGILFDDLPDIDIVLISHNHYDHLDLPTLKKLKEKFNPLFFVSLGNKDLLSENGFEKIVELDWWQNYQYNEVTKINYVPAKHFSMRGICDRNTTLWGGYVIELDSSQIYFAGDTGFGIHFEQIVKKFNNIKLSLLPIGAYQPTWFMSDYHLSPGDAVKAHKILKSKMSIGIHWGTFKQSDEGMFEPVKDLKAAIKKENIPSGEFVIPRHGYGYRLKN